MRLGVRHKLVLLATLVILGVSSGFTWLNLALTRQAIEEDLKARAIMFAREIAATIGDRRELESGRLLGEQIERIIDIRRSVLQLSRRDTDEVRRGQVVSRLVASRADRYWELMAPITLEGSVAGAVAVKF